MNLKPFVPIRAAIQEEVGYNVTLPFKFEQGKPFARANYWREIYEVTARMKDGRAALLLIPPYESRGHGRSKGFQRAWGSNSSLHGRNMKKPPINGKQECARRVPQGVLNG